MIATDRLDAERTFHDLQARERASFFARSPSKLRFTDAEFLDHESWVRTAFAYLGDVRGKRVLDYGCGHGMAAVVLARRRAIVTGFDLSGAYVREATRRARANHASATLVQADAHRLPFADHAFDAIWGSAILHHLDIAVAAAEIRRVLRPGGVAVFCEPWGGNPLLQWARRRLPYPGKRHTPDELPLMNHHLNALRECFPLLESHGCQLLSMARRIVNIRPLADALQLCDDWLLRWMPGLQRWSRYVVLVLRR